MFSTHRLIVSALVDVYSFISWIVSAQNSSLCKITFNWNLFFCSNSTGGRILNHIQLKTASSSIVLHYSEYSTSASHLACSAYTAEAPRNRQDAPHNIDDRIKRESDRVAENEWGSKGGKRMEGGDRTRRGKGQGGRISHVSLVLTFLSVSPGNEYPDINVPNWWWSGTGGGGGLFDVH